MRLAILNPHWTTTTEGRQGMGIMFDCPHCWSQKLGVWFANPLDGGIPAGPECAPTPRWHREGDTFETLTLSPSVDASAVGHWHGFITNGEIV